MQTITVYKPKGDPVTYVDPAEVNIEGGVLTFQWTKELSGKAQTVVTNLPFIIQHDIKPDRSQQIRSATEDSQFTHPQGIEF
jgi:hypothetical protein